MRPNISNELKNKFVSTVERKEYITDTLIISDIHMGSEVTRVKQAHELLERFKVGHHIYNIKRLILLGDIFDSMDLRNKRFRKWEWKFLGEIRKMTDSESNVEVIWLRGNHDPEIIDLISNLVGAHAFEEYYWEVGSKRFFAMHGDQFDKWVFRMPQILINIPDWIYHFIQKFDGNRHRLSRYIKEKSKVFLRLNEKVAAGIIKYIRDNKIYADVVICGHTHIEHVEYFEKEKVFYYNSGCWTGEDPPTYITIDKDGEIQINRFHHYPHERNPINKLQEA